MICVPKFARVLTFLGLALAGAAGFPILGEAASTETRFENLYVFTGRSDGAYPHAALIQATDGNFYGTTFSPGFGADFGTVFRMTPSGAVSLLHTFTGGAGGAKPRASVIQATDGNFYGTTTEGGSDDLGTIYRVTPLGAFAVLHSFTAADGANPRAALVQATDGNFYGTAFGLYSGADKGTIFRMTPAGTFTVLHAFTGGQDGANPAAGLIQATDGDLYGTASSGTAGLKSGTVFKMTLSGAFTVLHAFTGGPGGATPEASLLQATDGNFYGVTSLGGDGCCGTIFKMNANGAVTILHAFNGVDGSFPFAALMQATDGDFYGTTDNGGTGNAGTIFRMTPAGIVTALFSFTFGANGSTPQAGLLQAADGNLYGTAASGGFSFGVVFRLVLGPPPPRTSRILDLNGDSGGDVFLYNKTTGARRFEVTTGPTGFAEGPGSWDAGWQVYPVKLNHDQYTDFFLYDPVRGLWVQALNNNGDGTFVYTLGNWDRNWTVVPADLDGNGLTDLFVYNASAGAWVKCFVDGHGGFVWYVTGNWDPGWTLYTADLNGDGRDDFFLYNRVNGVWFEAFSKEGFAGFDYPASGGWDPGWQVFPGDLNGDGRTDLFLLNAAGVHVSALSRVAGGFDYVGGPQWSAGWSVSPGDLNGDGRTDLFLYNAATGVWVEAFSDGAGSFSYAAGNWDPGWSVAVTDFSGDGRDDIMLSRADGTWVMATNTGTAAFTYAAGNWGTGWSVFTRRLGDR
jgi:uncharacterized repeat protein (TIGR03803 family)